MDDRSRNRMAAVEQEIILMSLLPEHVDKAALWTTVHWWSTPRPLLPYLKRKFKLTDDEAMDVIRSASDAIMQVRQR